MSAKQAIDIEALLILAFRDRKIDRWVQRANTRKIPALNPGSPMRRIAELGTMVQGSGPLESTITTVIPDEYADLIAVHDAVLRLEDFYAEFQTESRIRLWTPEAASEEGGVISMVGAGGHREFTLALPKRKPRPLRPLSAAGLVIAAACSGNRPGCFPEWQPKRGRRALAAVDARGRARSNVDIDAREVALARASYQVWLMSLQWLAAELDGVLSAYAVTGPAAESEPWLLDFAA